MLIITKKGSDFHWGLGFLPGRHELPNLFAEKTFRKSNFILAARKKRFISQYEQACVSSVGRLRLHKVAIETRGRLQTPQDALRTGLDQASCPQTNCPTPPSLSFLTCKAGAMIAAMIGDWGQLRDKRKTCKGLPPARAARTPPFLPGRDVGEVHVGCYDHADASFSTLQETKEDPVFSRAHGRGGVRTGKLTCHEMTKSSLGGKPAFPAPGRCHEDRSPQGSREHMLGAHSRRGCCRGICAYPKADLHRGSRPPQQFPVRPEKLGRGKGKWRNSMTQVTETWSPPAQDEGLEAAHIVQTSPDR